MSVKIHVVSIEFVMGKPAISKRYSPFTSEACEVAVEAKKLPATNKIELNLNDDITSIYLLLRFREKRLSVKPK